MKTALPYMRAAAIAEFSAPMTVSDTSVPALQPIAQRPASLVSQNTIVISAMRRAAGATMSSRRRPPVFGIRKPSSSSV
jgi:hypothetical protein